MIAGARSFAAGTSPLGEDVTVLPWDVTSEESCAAFVKKALSRENRVDVLVCAAAQLQLRIPFRVQNRHQIVLRQQDRGERHRALPAAAWPRDTEKRIRLLRAQTDPLVNGQKQPLSRFRPADERMREGMRHVLRGRDLHQKRVIRIKPNADVYAAGHLIFQLAAGFPERQHRTDSCQLYACPGSDILMDTTLSMTEL